MISVLFFINISWVVFFGCDFFFFFLNFWGFLFFAFCFLCLWCLGYTLIFRDVARQGMGMEGRERNGEEGRGGEIMASHDASGVLCISGWLVYLFIRRRIEIEVGKSVSICGWVVCR